MRRGLISGITSGTAGSIRNADELSITTAPALTASGENFLEMPAPAENSAISTPANELSVSSSTTISCPRNSSVLPAERRLASAFSPPTGNFRLSIVVMNSAPTAPVTPTMAITGWLLTEVSPLFEHDLFGKPVPTFPDHAGKKKKAPDLFRRGFG